MYVALSCSMNQPMDIDQRIEALTQSVELLSVMHQDNEKRYAAQFTMPGENLHRLGENLHRLGENLHTLTGISESLARIAQDHEHRI